MKKIVFGALALSIALSFGCKDEHRELPASTEDAPLLTQQLPSSARRGLAYIKLRSGAQSGLRSVSGQVDTGSAPEELRRALGSIGVRSMEPLFPIDPRYEKRMRREGLHLWYVVRFDEDYDTSNALRALSIDDLVEIVEPAYEIIRPRPKVRPVDLSTIETFRASTFNDPLFSQQWSLHNTGSLPGFTRGADINVVEAWKHSTGKSNVIVAVTDGGIDYKHEDLSGAMWINLAEFNGEAGKDDDGNGYVDDIYGYNFAGKRGEIWPERHGTHVAGIIGARTNNGVGISGIAGGDGTAGTGVRLMSCQIFVPENAPRMPPTTAEQDDARAQEIFVYSANNGAVISQNSWGDDYRRGTVLPESYKAGIDYFIKYAGCDNDGNQKPDSPMKGGVVIFASGNDGMLHTQIPASYEPVVSVGAMGPVWKITGYTNYGRWLDVVAPGGDENAVNDERGMVFSTLPNGQYGLMQGTSMACPHASGVAALIVSKYGGPGFTANELKIRLLGALHQRNIDRDNPEHATKAGAGYLDAGAAFATNGGKRPDKVQDIAVRSVDFTTLTLGWSAVRDEDNGTAKQYDVYISTSPLNETNYTEAEIKRTVYSVGIPQGSALSLELIDLTPTTTYYFAVVAQDRWGLLSDVVFYSTATKTNHAPVIEGVPTAPIRLMGSMTKSFELKISDPDAQGFTVQVEGESRGVSYSGRTGTLSFTIRAVAPAGKYGIVVRVTDYLGLATEINIPFEVIAYQPPQVLASNMTVVTDKAAKLVIDPSTLVSSPGDLTWSITSSNESIATAQINEEGKLEILSGTSLGATQIRLVATDMRGVAVETELAVRVVPDASKLVYSAYPVPVRSNLNMLLNPKSKNLHIVVRSALGRPVYEQRVDSVESGFLSLGLGILAPGQYVLEVTSEGQNYKQVITKY